MTKHSTANLVALLREKSADSNAETEAEILRFSVAHQERVQIQNRISWYGIGSWLMVITAATVGAVFAFMLSDFIDDVFNEVARDGYSNGLLQPWPPKIIATLIALVAVLSLIMLIGGLLLKRLPGTYGVIVAADWANVCDALGQLIKTGTAYPEAFRAARSISRTSELRRWLSQLAEGIESGRSGPISKIAAKSITTRDSAMVAVLVEHSEQDPSAGWMVAAKQFDRIARRRFELNRTMLPIFSTLVAGLLLWLSLAGTLGWMWRRIYDLIDRMGMLYW